MKKLLSIAFLFFLFACSDTQTPDLPAPAKVIMVPRSDDMAEVERGIDAVPESDGIQIQWYDLHDRNVKSYKIYRKNENETFYSLVKTIDLETAFPGSDTTYIDAAADLKLNSYNYYCVIAVNKDDMEGQPSDTLRYKLLSKPLTSNPNGEISGMPKFYWSFPVVPDSFILRIEEDFTGRLHFIRKFRSNYDNEYQELDLSQIENPPQFNSTLWYKWRIDIIGPEPQSSGAESDWLSFKKVN